MSPLQMYYSQCGEDAYIHKFFPKRRNGVFLEMGALDGVTYSNTKFFEDTLGWTGVLIEPLPDRADACKRNRPRSKVFACAVSQSEEPVEIYANNAVSSLKNVTTPEYYDAWHKGKHIDVKTVPSRRLDSILHEAGIRYIDFWSLDVEGAEYEVLQTMDWSIPVYLICVEMAGGSYAEMNEQCRTLLTEKGFQKFTHAAHNEIWINAQNFQWRILCADTYLKGKPHADWKEGYELQKAFRNLGYMCDIVGPNSLQYQETDIPRIAENYDLIVVTENYPEVSRWKWWNWKSIRTPKLFWAIDTHMRSYPWLHEFEWLAYNIPEHLSNRNSFWLPYGISSSRYTLDRLPKQYDIIFVGSKTAEREEICKRHGITMLSAFGDEYLRIMKQGKICFNKSISNDINAKYFEIMASGSFMLTNYNPNLLVLFDDSADLEACMYKTEEELERKIHYYLEHEDERETIAFRLQDCVLKNHTWENRCKTILSSLVSFPNLQSPQKVDKTLGIHFPWYTHTFLKELSSWDISEWDVFEYGAGDSTKWWRTKVKSVDSVDNSKEWSEKTGAIFEDTRERYIQKPLELGKKYDCVVIDGLPVDWRDDCTEYALQCLKPKGVIIADNYHQTTNGCGKWSKTDHLLARYPCVVFRHPGHIDWSTAYWKISH